MTARKTQVLRILWLLQSAFPGWVSAWDLSRISLGYGRAIHDLRKKHGYIIANKIVMKDGKRNGFFRLGPPPTPRSAILRARREPPPAEAEKTLFGDTTPDRTYRE